MSIFFYILRFIHYVLTFLTSNFFIVNNYTLLTICKMSLIQFIRSSFFLQNFSINLNFYVKLCGEISMLA